MQKWIIVFSCMCAMFSQNIYSSNTGPAVISAWTRPTAPGQTVAAAYVDIRNASKFALIGAETSIAIRAELHESIVQSGIMKMRQRPRIEAGSKGNITLSPMGIHLMLIDIKAPLKQGQRIPLTFVLVSSDHPERIIRLQAELIVTPDEPDIHQHHH